jgi:hypothetical protein
MVRPVAQGLAPLRRRARRPRSGQIGDTRSPRRCGRDRQEDALDSWRTVFRNRRARRLRSARRVGGDARAPRVSSEFLRAPQRGAVHQDEVARASHDPADVLSGAARAGGGPDHGPPRRQLHRARIAFFAVLVFTRRRASRPEGPRPPDAAERAPGHQAAESPKRGRPPTRALAIRLGRERAARHAERGGRGRGVGGAIWSFWSPRGRSSGAKGPRHGDRKRSLRLPPGRATQSAAEPGHSHPEPGHSHPHQANH